MSSVRVDPPHRSGLRMADCSISTHPADARAGCIPEYEPMGKTGLRPLISVVIPAKNEAASLPTLLEEVTQTLHQLLCPEAVADREESITFEVIIVDDGSTDKTREILTALAATYRSLQPLHLTVSIGQSGCLIAGIRRARGVWIATLDADLQNHPADLALLWKALPGYDAVLGWRVKRADPWSKRTTSWIANQVRNAVLGQVIRDTGCGVRILSRSFALRLPAFRGVHRFIGPLLLREGCRIAQVPVSHRPRIYGQSHYNFWNRSWAVLLDLVGVAWLMHRPLIHDQYEQQPLASRSNPTSTSMSPDGSAKTRSGWTGQTARMEVEKTCAE